MKLFEIITTEPFTLILSFIGGFVFYFFIIRKVAQPKIIDAIIKKLKNMKPVKPENKNLEGLKRAVH